MTDPTPFVFANDRVSLSLDARAYRLSAIKKSAYRFADRFSVAVRPSASADVVSIELLFKLSTDERVARDAVAAFLRELLDQELREQIAEETAPLRTLILAQAFSKTDLIRRE